MRIRTSKDNRQLRDDEVQIEDLNGAVSVCSAGEAGRVVGAPPGVKITTVRGIAGRKAQVAVLSKEGVDRFIEELIRVRDRVFPAKRRKLTVGEVRSLKKGDPVEIFSSKASDPSDNFREDATVYRISEKEITLSLDDDYPGFGEGPSYLLEGSDKSPFESPEGSGWLTSLWVREE